MPTPVRNNARACLSERQAGIGWPGSNCTRWVDEAMEGFSAIARIRAEFAARFFRVRFSASRCLKPVTIAVVTSRDTRRRSLA
jgi:hypothetical protein